MLRLTVETETGHIAEIRVERTVYKRFEVKMAAHVRRILTPFVTLKSFDDEVKADDYAVTLKAAILGVSVGEVEP